MDAKKIVGIIIILIIILFGWYYYKDFTTPGVYNEFAQCLADSDVTYYGAFWCPNCANQNELFGKSKEFVPYVECSTPNGQGQLQVCKDANITAYPTWEFADGSRVTGVQSLESLSEKTGCALPQEG